MFMFKNDARVSELRQGEIINITIINVNYPSEEEHIRRNRRKYEISQNNMNESISINNNSEIWLDTK